MWRIELFILLIDGTLTSLLLARPILVYFYLFPFLSPRSNCSNLLMFKSVLMLSRVWLFVATWTVVCQAPLSMEFSGQEYWSRLHFLLQGIFSTQGSICISCISYIDRWILYHWCQLGNPMFKCTYKMCFFFSSVFVVLSLCIFSLHKWYWDKVLLFKVLFTYRTPSDAHPNHL